LTDAEIILNIQAENEENYFVFMLEHEDFSAYLHLPPRFLDEIVEKYGLENSHESKDYTISEFLIEEHMEKPLN
jgi:hypothetical protein